MAENAVEIRQEISLKGKVKRAFNAVSKHPTVLFSIGNAFLSATTGNPLGALLQSGVALATASIVAKASWSGKEADSLKSRYAFLVTGAVAMTTAVSGFMTAFTGGIPSLASIISDNATRNAFLGNSAFAFWGSGDLLTALRSKKNMVAYGGGEISSALSNPQTLNPMPFSATVLGLAKALYDNLRPAKAAEHEKKKDLVWHITPSRLYGLSYVFNGCIGMASAMATGQAKDLVPAAQFFVATAFWTASAIGFNPEQNKDVADRLRRHFDTRRDRKIKNKNNSLNPKL